MKTSLLFRVTGIAVFIQMALGGLLTFDYVDASIHIAVGAVVFLLAVLTLGLVVRQRPRPRQLTGLSAGQVVLVVAQALLGFSTLDTGDATVAWVHLIIAMAIYGMAISGTFMALEAEKMSRQAPMVAPA